MPKTKPKSKNSSMLTKSKSKRPVKSNKKSRLTSGVLSSRRNKLALIFCLMFAAGGVYLLARSNAVYISKFPLSVNRSDIINHSPQWCYRNSSPCHHDYPAADIFANPGTPVVAARDGKIIRLCATDSSGRLQSRSNCPNGIGSSGGRVAIKGSDNLYYAYYHMAPNSIPSGLVIGSSVSGGAALGKVGDAKAAQGTPPHLHFQITKVEPPACDGPSCPDSQFINPQPSLVDAFNKLSGGSTPPPASSASCPDKKGDYKGSHSTISEGSTNKTCVHHVQYLVDLAGKYDKQPVEAAVTYTDVFDSTTKKGVINYQKRKGLSTQSGKVDLTTWNSLHRLCKYVNDHPNKNGTTYRCNQ